LSQQIDLLTSYELELRVRYDECDPMGFVHHSNYLRYFEIARTEMLRASGGCYREVEDNGLYVVVVRLECRYLKPAKYDDMLTVKAEVTRVTAAKIEHEYSVRRNSDQIVRGNATLAVIDAAGHVKSVPPFLGGN
jgi:acyl-CoA thioester hydrolase